MWLYLKCNAVVKEALCGQGDQSVVMQKARYWKSDFSFGYAHVGVFAPAMCCA